MGSTSGCSHGRHAKVRSRAHAGSKCSCCHGLCSMQPFCCCSMNWAYVTAHAEACASDTVRLDARLVALCRPGSIATAQHWAQLVYNRDHALMAGRGLDCTCTQLTSEHCR